MYYVNIVGPGQLSFSLSHTGSGCGPNTTKQENTIYVSFVTILLFSSTAHLQYYLYTKSNLFIIFMKSWGVVIIYTLKILVDVDKSYWIPKLLINQFTKIRRLGFNPKKFGSSKLVIANLLECDNWVLTKRKKFKTRNWVIRKD